MEKIFILGLAAYRITRFLIEDKLIERPRKRLLGKGLEHGWFHHKYNQLEHKTSRFWWNELYILLNCAYCLSIWLTFALWALYDRWTPLDTLVHILAVAAIVSVIYDLRTDDIKEQLEKIRKGETD